ncbi:TonB-dependent receptor [Kordiimonas sp.]|uniref:TonB-dependent receptor n=1 Tax=Kordiimonas sp. TaxID=1970157 RepID=UPI003A91303B
MRTSGKLYKTLLAATVATLPLEMAVAAQEGDQSASSSDMVFEEIVVTGIRGSLKSSIGMKRDANVVVDGISAEDLGVFPDGNVAESLQRITGVSISRSGGEGRFITVRGLGPEYNTVLANGRILATENAGREFSMDVLASELINGAQVYKGSQANLTEGAIGGTVNMTTWRPFDIDGQRIVVSGAGTYDTNSKKEDIKGSALYSNTWNDGTVGFLASLSYSTRNVNTHGTFSDGLTSYDIDLGNDGVIDHPDTKVLYSQRYQVFEQDRERLGGTAVFQFAPSDNHKITIDGLFSKFDVDDKSTEIAYPFNSGGGNNWSNVTIEDGILVKGTKTTFADVIQASTPRDTSTYQIGFNHDWQVSDRLNVTTDVAYSEAEGKGFGRSRFYVVRKLTEMTYDLYGGDFPLVTTVEDLNNPSGYRSHVASHFGNDTKDTVFEGKIDFTYDLTDFGVLKAVSGGVYYSDREKDVLASTRGPCATCYNGGPVEFTDASIFSPFNPSGLLGGSRGTFDDAWVSFNFDDVVAFYQSEAALSQLTPERRADVEARLAAGGYAPMISEGGSSNIREKSYATYMQVELGDDNWGALLGGRLVSTDQVSTGQFVELIGVEEIVNSDGTVENRNPILGAPEVVGFDNKYTYFLPNASFRMNITDDVILRAGYSQTLTRPTLSSLSTGVSYNVQVGAERISGSNPLLKPFRSKNYDASIEWYFDDVGALTFAAFHKDLSSFLLRTTESEILHGIDFASSRPRNAGAATITGFEVAYQQIFDMLPTPFDGLGVQANYTFIDSTGDFSSVGGDAGIPLVGLSKHNYNLVGFYEKGPIGLRLAYNYRSDYLSEPVTWLGDTKNASSFGQLDFRGSYNVTENIQVYVEGINITNATTGDFFNGDKNIVTGFSDFGARYAAGIRFQF